MPLTYPFGGLREENALSNPVHFDIGLYEKCILVTGANGQLGNELRQLAIDYPNFRFDFTDIGELDLCNAEAVLEYCRLKKPSYIINAAAYTAVEKAEEDEATCRKVNRDAVENLARAAIDVNALMLHVSTDYVFDGTSSIPLVETDPVCPVSVYGRTKLEGEQVLESICTRYAIIRTAWLYSSFGNNFVKTMIRLGREREALQVVSDQIGSPTYAGDLAEALMEMIESAEEGHFEPGIYHYSNEGVCSWYEFTLKIHELAGITTCKVSPIASKDYPAKVQRPAYSLLNKEKIKATYGITVPHWEESLAVCTDLLK